MSKPPQRVSELALCSLAILKVNWDTHGRDYIANFVPFVRESLKNLGQDVVSLDELREQLFADFGLAIPHGPLRAALVRAEREGFVKVESGVYHRTPKVREDADFAPTRERVLREQGALIQKLIAFVEERRDVQWPEDTAEDALLSAVVERAGPILAASTDGKRLDLDLGEDSSAKAYLVYSFIIHLHERDPDGFEYLENLVKGSMLANALYYPDINAITERMRGVEVFFDTRIVLEALVGNEYQKKARRELFELVDALGGHPKIFEDTQREIVAVLQNEARTLRRGTVTQDRQYGVLTQQLIDDGRSASDVELIIGRLPRLLGTMRVTVAARPGPVKSLTVDESKLEATLRAGGRYHRPEPLRHDIDVITAIYRLRRGERKYKLERAGALFVTTNYPMVTAAREFLNDEYELGGVPHCYRDAAFETLIWLKKPLRAPQLPRRRILADCLVAMRPSEELWALYSHEIEKLRQDGDLAADDFTVLKHSLEAKIELMELTLGEPAAFSEGTVAQVLERARATIQGEAVSEIADLQHRLSAADARDEERRTALVLRAEGHARFVFRGLVSGLVAVLGVLLYLTLPDSFNGLSHHVNKLIAPIVLAAFVVLGLLTIGSLVFGTSAVALLQPVERRLEDALRRVYFRFAAIDETAVTE